jgi:hypothetical protein
LLKNNRISTIQKGTNYSNWYFDYTDLQALYTASNTLLLIDNI